MRRRPQLQRWWLGVLHRTRRRGNPLQRSSRSGTRGDYALEPARFSSTTVCICHAACVVNRHPHQPRRARFFFAETLLFASSSFQAIPRRPARARAARPGPEGESTHAEWRLRVRFVREGPRLCQVLPCLGLRRCVLKKLPGTNPRQSAVQSSMAPTAFSRGADNGCHVVIAFVCIPVSTHSDPPQVLPRVRHRALQWTVRMLQRRLSVGGLPGVRRAFRRTPHRGDCPRGFAPEPRRRWSCHRRRHSFCCRCRYRCRRTGHRASVSRGARRGRRERWGCVSSSSSIRVFGEGVWV